MPVAAAGLTDVGAADAEPAVLLRGGDHRGEQLAVGSLGGGADGERLARLGGADGERVAQLLQLAEAEHPRRPGGAHPVGDRDPAEPGGDQSGQLQLELADLAAQLGAGASLVGPQPHVLCNPLGDKGHGVRPSVKQIRHDLILSRLEGRGGNP